MIGFMVIMNTLLANKKSYKGEMISTICPGEGEQE